MNQVRVEKRISSRKPARTRGEINNDVSGGKWPIDVVDISVGGISFLSASEFAKGSMWLVRLELNGRIVRGVVTIAYCVKHTLTDAYRLGAAFMDLEEQYEVVISRFVDES